MDKSYHRKILRQGNHRPQCHCHKFSAKLHRLGLGEETIGYGPSRETFACMAFEYTRRLEAPYPAIRSQKNSWQSDSGSYARGK